MIGAAERDRKPGLVGRVGVAVPARIPGRELDRAAMGDQGRQRAGEIEASRAASGRGIESDGRDAVAERGSDEPGEACPRPELEEQRAARRRHGPKLVDEAHLASQLPGQQGAAGLGLIRVELAGGVGVDRRAGGEGDIGEARGEPGLGVRHEARVEGRRHRQLLAAQPGGLEAGPGVVDLRLTAAEHDLIRRVVICGDELQLPLGDPRFDLIAGGVDGQHAAAIALALAHEAAAQDREAMQLVAAQTTGGAERDQLAVAVPAEGLGRDAEALREHAPAAEPDRAERRLGRPGVREAPALRGPGVIVEGRGRIDDVAETGAVVGRRKGCVDLGQGLEQLRELAGQVAQHADLLGALTGEQHRDLGRLDLAASQNQAVRARLNALARRVQQAPRRSEAARQAVLIHERRDEQPERAPRLEARARLRRDGPTTARAGRRDAVELGMDRDRVVAGEGEELNLPIPVRRDLDGLMLLEQAVKIAAAEAERADPGAARVLGPRQPGAGLDVDVKGAVRGADERLRLADLDGRRQHLVVQREGRLDESGDPGGGLGVADLALDRADRAPAAPLALGLVKDRREAAQLGRVADLGAGAVGLDQLDRGRAHIGELVGVSKGPGLAGGGGRVDRLTAAVRGRAEALEHGVDRVAVALGIGEALHHDEADSLAEDRAVASGVEGPRVTGRAQRRRLREAHVHKDVVEGVDAAGDGHVGAPRGQLEGREVERAQGTGAGRINNAVRAAEVEAVRDPARDDVAEQAGERGLLPVDVAIADAGHDVVRDLRSHAGVAKSLAPDRVAEPGAERHDQLERAGDAEHDAGAAVIVVPIRPVAGVLESALRDHEREQLRGVRGLDRLRRHAVVERVEVDRREEAAGPRVGVIRARRVGIKVVRGRPMRLGHLPDAVDALTDGQPVAVPSFRVWKEAGHPHECQGDRSPVRTRHGDLLRSGAARRRKRPAAAGAARTAARRVPDCAASGLAGASQRHREC